MSSLMEVRDLVEHYRNIKAVGGINFTVEHGDRFGPPDPSGAGEVTTVEMPERAYPRVTTLARIVSFTHTIDGTQAVMISGGGLAEITSRLTVLSVTTVGFLLAGAFSFRWE